MKWIALSFTTCFLITFFQSGNATAQSKSKKPNIIFILADDLGYGNISSFNPKAPVPTPNIDKMAKEGTRFTRFYAGSTVCAPSRASLMTGKHMGHAYVRGNGNVSLRVQDSTLAQQMQRNGYATGMFGKWGLGLENEPGAPHLKGFDSFYGYLLQRHAHYYFTDHLFEVKNRQLNKVKIDSSEYTQDLIVNKALSFIKEHKENPFFLYLPITLPHAELKVPQGLMKKYLNPDGSSKFGPEKPYYQKGESYHTQLQPRAAFAAMIDKMDQDVGRVLKLVKDLGLDDNTYIFFTSDNGPHSEGGGDPLFFNSSGPLRGEKRDMYEGGIRVPLIVRAPGKVPAGKTREDIWAFWDIMPTFNVLSGSTPAQNIDGLSFVNALSGKTQKEKHDYLYWQFNEGQYKEALLQENWKLIRFKEKGKPEVLELYNLKTDIAEKHNLISQKPVKTNRLLSLMKQARSPAENSLFDWTDLEQ
ncbi:arylsulfatase [Pedobacter sp. P351]|uniref:arylsulfatase n=1 Tax=Pedobacter superstes TaxID=3133441 RepID=UPI0030AFA66D